MNDASLTPIELYDNPELAALRILETSLAVAQTALVAMYPDNCEPPHSRHCRSEAEAYAFSILYQIDALAAVLGEYSESIRRLQEFTGRESQEDESTLF
jgi:hypothetical protein